MRGWLIALCVGGAACGNYSTEDLRFISALPRRQDMSVAVPSNTAGGPTALTALAAPTAACPLMGPAKVWQWAKPTSDNLNAAVAWIVGLIDNVRKVSPTHRTDDTRRWGPFDDDKHPGHEIQVVMERNWSGETPTYLYRFEARAKGTTPFVPLIWGAFAGDSASTGTGTVTLDFKAFHDVGVADASTPAGGSIVILYDRRGDPVTTDLTLDQDGFGVVGGATVNYGYSGFADGRGAFDYAFRDNGDLLEVWTSHEASGAGMLRVKFTGALGNTGYFNQCFDAAGCLVYVDDPLNLSCPAAQAPCSYTVNPGACTPGPTPPFTP